MKAGYFFAFQVTTTSTGAREATLTAASRQRLRQVQTSVRAIYNGRQQREAFIVVGDNGLKLHCMRIL